MSSAETPTPVSDEFATIVAAVSPHACGLALAARALIYDVYPQAVEVPWPRQRVIGYGVGPKKMTEHFCYIAVSTNHINIGFNYGSELPDPEQLLQGPGKLLRHVKILHSDDVAKPALRRLLEAAAVHRMPVKQPSRP